MNSRDGPRNNRAPNEANRPTFDRQPEGRHKGPVELPLHTLMIIRQRWPVISSQATRQQSKRGNQTEYEYKGKHRQVDSISEPASQPIHLRKEEGEPKGSPLRFVLMISLVVKFPSTLLTWRS